MKLEGLRKLLEGKGRYNSEVYDVIVDTLSTLLHLLEVRFTFGCPID